MVVKVFNLICDFSKIIHMNTLDYRRPKTCIHIFLVPPLIFQYLSILSLRGWNRFSVSFHVCVHYHYHQILPTHQVRTIPHYFYDWL